MHRLADAKSTIVVYLIVHVHEFYWQKKFEVKSVMPQLMENNSNHAVSMLQAGVAKTS